MGEVSVLFAVEAEQLMMAELYEEAVELCKHGLIVYPEYASAYGIIARAYAMLGDNAAAEKAIEESINLFPSNKLLKSIKTEIFSSDELPESSKDVSYSETISKPIPEPAFSLDDFDFGDDDKSDEQNSQESIDDIFNNIESASNIADEVLSNIDISEIQEKDTEDYTEPLTNDVLSEDFFSSLNFDDDAVQEQEEITESNDIGINEEKPESDLGDFADLLSEFGARQTDTEEKTPEEINNIIENIDSLIEPNENAASELENTVLNYESSSTYEYLIQEPAIEQIDAEQQVINIHQETEETGEVLEFEDVYSEELSSDAFEMEAQDYLQPEIQEDFRENGINDILLNSLSEESVQELNQDFDYEEEYNNKIKELEKLEAAEDDPVTNSADYLMNLTEKLNKANGAFRALETQEEPEPQRYNFAESTYDDELDSIQIDEFQEIIEDIAPIDTAQEEDEIAEHLRKYIGLKGFISYFTKPDTYYDKRFSAKKLDLIPGLDNTPIRELSNYSRKQLFNYALPVQPELCIMEALPADTLIEGFQSFLGYKPELIGQEEDISTVFIPSQNPQKELITETLANIYYMQGAYQEAIKAYLVLSEAQPEKKEYFELKISEVRKKEENDSQE